MSIEKLVNLILSKPETKNIAISNINRNNCAIYYARFSTGEYARRWIKALKNMMQILNLNIDLKGYYSEIGYQLQSNLQKEGYRFTERGFINE